MKVGFSFGRCLRDIVIGKVDIEDVLVIICRTYMSNSEDLAFVVESYSNDQRRLFGLNYMISAFWLQLTYGIKENCTNLAFPEFHLERWKRSIFGWTFM
jgi:hypothetical protein